MRTVYIMIEGPTEEEFINNSLAYYLRNFGLINVVPIRLETSAGFTVVMLLLRGIELMLKTY